MTSRTNKANSYRIFLPESELIPDEGCDPFVDSVALCDHVRVIDKAQIHKKVGNLTENARHAVGLGLAYVLDLP